MALGLLVRGMTAKDFWLPLLASILGSSSVATVVGLIFNRWYKMRDDVDESRRKLDFTEHEQAITAQLKEQQTRFEHLLGQERDTFKATLDKQLSYFNNRHSIFCQRQADALADIYSLLWKARDAVSHLGSIPQLAAFLLALPHAKAQHDKAAEYFLFNLFYFTDELANVVRSLLKSYMDL